MRGACFWQRQREWWRNKKHCLKKVWKKIKNNRITDCISKNYEMRSAFSSAFPTHESLHVFIVCREYTCLGRESGPA